MTKLTLRTVKRLITDGIDTSHKIAEELGLDSGYVSKSLKEWTDGGLLARYKAGRSYVYYIPEDEESEESDWEDGLDASESETESTEETVEEEEPDYSAWASAREFSRGPEVEYGIHGGDSSLARRSHDFDADIPPEGVEYISSNGEWEEILALIESREATGFTPRFYLGGPAGTGKTTLPEAVASKFQGPHSEPQAKHSTPTTDLIGGPKVVAGGETIWLDDDLAIAMQSAAERPTVLVIDEINRARAQAKGDLFSVLDHRGTLHLPFTGETIKTNPQNLIVFATLNEGPGFITEKLDNAEQKRLGLKYNIEYLGVNHPDEEAGLIAGRSPISQPLAKEMVEVANHVRRLASDGDVPEGIPTRELIRWAQAAVAFDDAGFENPLVKAADSAIVRHMYYRDGKTTEAADTVSEVIRSKFSRTPADPVKYAEYVGLPEPDAVEDEKKTLGDLFDADADTESVDVEVLDGEHLECVECGFAVPKDVAEDDGLTDSFECPECPGDLVWG